MTTSNSHIENILQDCRKQWLEKIAEVRGAYQGQKSTPTTDPQTLSSIWFETRCSLQMFAMLPD
jgi:hypothetical protein